MMHRSLIASRLSFAPSKLLLLLLVPLLGCEQLTATTNAAAFLTSSPDLAQAEGLDGSGLAGVLPLDELEVNDAVVIAVGLGERDSATSTEPPEPISDANVRLAWGSQEITVCPLADAAGAYEANSYSSSQDCGSSVLAYEVGTTYITRIETGTDYYTLHVQAPAPVIASSVDFTPSLNPSSDFFGASLPRHSRNAALTLDWSRDPAATERHGIVVVARIRYTGGQEPQDALDPTSWQAEPKPVYDSLPRDAEGMIDLVMSEPVPSHTIPGTTFDTAGVYIVVLTSMEVSKEVSTNLFLGSNFMAGKGTAFIFRVD